jgi:hypothetical protein
MFVGILQLLTKNLTWSGMILMQTRMEVSQMNQLRLFSFLLLVNRGTVEVLLKFISLMALSRLLQAYLLN